MKGLIQMRDPIRATYAERPFDDKTTYVTIDTSTPKKSLSSVPNAAKAFANLVR